jgi:hypothetical protein
MRERRRIVIGAAVQMTYFVPQARFTRDTAVSLNIFRANGRPNMRTGGPDLSRTELTPENSEF